MQASSLARLIAGQVYVGVSAGSMIFSRQLDPRTAVRVDGASGHDPVAEVVSEGRWRLLGRGR